MRNLNKLILSVTVIGLTGCGIILSPQSKPLMNEYEIISTNQSITTNKNSCNGVKNIDLFIAAARGVAPYDSYKMYYTDDKYKINSYGYNQWISTPSDMIGRVFVKNIVGDCEFKNSVTSISTANVQYRVLPVLDILRNEAVDGKLGGAMNAHLEMTVTLVDSIQNYTVAVMHFDEIMPTDGTPAGYVDSVNKLVGRFSDQTISWLKDNTQPVK